MDYYVLRLGFKEHLSEKSSPATIHTYCYEIRRFTSFLEEQELHLGRDSVQKYLDSLTEKGITAVTVNKIFRAIRSFCRYIEMPECAENIRLVKMHNANDQAPKSLRRLERIHLIETAEEEDTIRNIAIIHTLLNTGLRVKELSQLNRDDIIITKYEGELRVRQGKGNKERTLPLNKDVRDALAVYLKQRKDKNPALFLGRKGRLGVRGIQHVLEKYEIHPHRLRHTFITDIVRNHDLILAQALSGHASPDMLARYSKPSKEDLQNAVEEMYKK